MKKRTVSIGVVVAAAVAGLAVGLVAHGGGSKTPSTANKKVRPNSVTRWSERGLYRATIASFLNPVRINKLHAWTIHLETGGGTPVDDSSVAIKVVWPHTGKPMQTRPLITARGDGNYLIEGLKLQMTGMWRVSFAVAAAQGRDTLSYDLTVDDVGGPALDVKLLPTAVRRSARGLYRATIFPDVDPIPIN